MFNIESVHYLCVKFHNFLASGSMGCHRLEKEKKMTMKKRYIRCLAPNNNNTKKKKADQPDLS